MNNDTITVIVPTYNERENVAALVRRVAATLSHYSYEILIIDDNSADGTAELARSLANKYPIKVIVRRDKRGLASAVVDGIGYASGQVIGVMDADLQHPPEVIPDLVKEIEEGADIAIASRYAKGGSSAGWSLTRKIISRGAIIIAHLLLPATRKVSDPMSGFFMFRKSVVSEAHLQPTGYKRLLEILMEGKFQKTGEVPYTFATRDRGASKLNTRQQVDYLRHVFSLMRRTGELIRFVKFCIVGASGVGVNLGLFWVLTRFAGLKENDFLALAAGIEASILSNFTLNEFFTFRDRRSAGSSFLTRLFKFNLISLVGAGVQAGVYALLNHVLGIYDLVSNLIGIALATLWNYLVNNWWTWKQ